MRVRRTEVGLQVEARQAAVEVNMFWVVKAWAVSVDVVLEVAAASEFVQE